MSIHLCEIGIVTYFFFLKILELEIRQYVIVITIHNIFRVIFFGERFENGFNSLPGTEFAIDKFAKQKIFFTT